MLVLLMRLICFLLARNVIEIRELIISLEVWCRWNASCQLLSVLLRGIGVRLLISIDLLVLLALLQVGVEVGNKIYLSTFELLLESNLIKLGRSFLIRGPLSQMLPLIHWVLLADSRHHVCIHELILAIM
jgi:hypothetical protein